MENATSNKGKNFLSVVAVIFALGAYGGLGCLYQYTQKLEGIIAKQQVEIQNNRKIYFYNMEEVLRSLDVVSARTNYETEILKLNDELFAAEKKIKSIKDAKVKADFSDIYLNNLKLKRDELTANYEKSLNEITDKLNNALVTVAKQKMAPTIFVQNAIAVSTENTEDVTDEIIKIVKSK